MSTTATPAHDLRTRLDAQRAKLRDLRAEHAHARVQFDKARERFARQPDAKTDASDPHYAEAAATKRRLDSVTADIEAARDDEIKLLELLGGAGKGSSPRNLGDLSQPGAWLASIAQGSGIMADGGDDLEGAITLDVVGTSAPAAAFADRLARASAVMAMGPSILRIETSEVRLPRMSGRLAAAQVVPELAPIDEVEVPLDQMTITPPKIAVLQAISEEAWADARPETLAAIEREMIRAIASGFDSLALDGLEGDPDLVGILATSQAGAIDATQADDGGVGLDAFTDAATAVRSAGGEPDAVLLSPVQWGRLTKVKRSDDSRVPLVSAELVADAPRLSLGGLRVHLTEALDPGVAVVLRASEVLVVERGPVEVRVAENWRFSEAAIGARVLYRAAAILPQGQAAAVISGLPGGELLSAS